MKEAMEKWTEENQEKYIENIYNSLQEIYTDDILFFFTSAN